MYCVLERIEKKAVVTYFKIGMIGGDSVETRIGTCQILNRFQLQIRRCSFWKIKWSAV